MAINFPDTPANGDIYTVNSVTYTWNSTAIRWEVNTALTANVINTALGYTAYNGNANPSGFINSFNNSDSFYYNSRTISANVTIAANQAALSVGSIVIANNVTVAIDDGGEWSIV
jgi:hypothetical protein